ncbi:MAG: PEP-CTERM sorting domain-containing protein [Burkholderiaceae bacterium]|jgi:hypothetical protein
MKSISSLLVASLVAAASGAHAQTTLYSQNFEAPVNFVDDGGDINIFRTVNQLYGNQPVGFTFTQPYTDETLRVGGTGAFGTGYKDPQHIAGNYVVSMLSDAQPDLLSMSFSVGNFQFLNFGLDISSIDLDRFGGPFVPTGGTAPVFQFSLFDNPSGATNQSGNGVLLDSATATGVAGPNKYTFDWTHEILGFNAAGSTNGNVTLQIDLLSGGYAAMDNFVVVASDEKGVIPTIPEPGSWLLMGLGLATLALRARKASRVG